MPHPLLDHLRELIRETYDGGLPGQGTQYLDHGSGIRKTLGALTAEQASRSRNGHPSIAAHARHMAFHLRVVAEWVEGVRKQRDWVGSFQPYAVTDAEWTALRHELDEARAEFMRAMGALPPETFVAEGAGLGALAHLAYHLGAIRQLMHEV